MCASRVNICFACGICPWTPQNPVYYVDLTVTPCIGKIYKDCVSKIDFFSDFSSLEMQEFRSSPPINRPGPPVATEMLCHHQWITNSIHVVQSITITLFKNKSHNNYEWCCGLCAYRWIKISLFNLTLFPSRKMSFGLSWRPPFAIW